MLRSEQLTAFAGRRTIKDGGTHNEKRGEVHVASGTLVLRFYDRRRIFTECSADR